MQDKRLVHRLTEYWNNLRAEKALPLWERFDAEAFADIWNQCCGWKIEAGEGSSYVFTYDHVGDLIKKAVGVDPSGQIFKSQLPTRQGVLPVKKIEGAKRIEEMFSEHFKDFPVASIIKKIDRVINKAQPVVDEGRFTDSDNKTIRYRSCLLPFGKVDGGIERIVLGLSWKNY